MADIEFTREQRAAIDHRGGDLLVAAAAGSGKTRVLVQRLMDQVESGDDVSQFLIITYTRAAAAELRGRILEEISSRTAQRPSKHLSRQSALIYQADIGTIHSFCGKIIREFAHVLDISPEFRTADEGESTLILHQVLEDCLEERYSHIDDHPGFALLADTVSSGRNDNLLADTVLETHAKLLSHPYPDKWAGECLSDMDFSGLKDAGETVWGRYLLDRAKGAAEYWLGEMERARHLLCEDDKLERAYGPSWDETIAELKQFNSALEVGWDEAHSCGDIPFPRPKPVPGYEGIKDLRRRCKSALDKLTCDFSLTSKELFSDLEAVSPAVTALLDLVLDLDRAYSEEKGRRSIYDFSDLEHLAVKLLVDRETYGPTSTAGEIAKRYKEVMVDEFQDVSGIQDMIFRALGEYGASRFMVGDVKQSIYRFRLADPTIFLKYYSSFADPEDARDSEGQTLLLNKNFRSRPGILEAVNFIFRRIMSDKLGEIDYGDRQALNPGLTETGDEGPPVELTLLDLSTFASDGSDLQEMAEPRYVARRIRELHDQEGYAWSDFAILLRSLRGKTEGFERALDELGIPAAKTTRDTFFYSPEISCVLSLLQIIINPLQDVPLISVLRSPLFCFTPDELAEIRSEDRSLSFYDALVINSQTNDKSSRFLESLSLYRDMAPDMPSDKFLWYLYSETGALSIFGGMDKGDLRRKNLTSLLSYARRIEGRGYKGLFSLVSILDKQIEIGDIPDLGTPSGGADAVNIMSIHKSKGLEYPVVILPDLSKKFNTQDTTRQILIHPKLGIGSIRRDPQRKIRYSTLARTAISKKLRQETLSEELRVLYVAMTRAQDRLIMTAALKNPDGVLSRLAPSATDPVSPYVLESASNMAEWVLLPSMTRPESGVLRGDTPVPLADCGYIWKISLLGYNEFYAEHTEDGVKLDTEVEADWAEDLVPREELNRRLSFVYGNLQATHVPSKLTATELKGRDLDLEAEDQAVSYRPKAKAPIFRRPEFVQKDRPLTGAQRGTATHLVMQYIDFVRCRDLSGIKGEIRRLESEKRISRQAAQAVDPSHLWSFFQSDLGRHLLSAKNLRREFKFSLLVPAQRFLNTGGDEKVLLQGVVDCFIEEEDGLTVIDFKTDYVRQDTLEQATLRYQGQMEAYAYALSRITGRPVKRALIYFFSLGESVSIIIPTE